MKVYFTAKHNGIEGVVESDTIEEAKDCKDKLRAKGAVCDPGLLCSSFDILSTTDSQRQYIMSLLSV